MFFWLLLAAASSRRLPMMLPSESGIVGTEARGDRFALLVVDM